MLFRDFLYGFRSFITSCQRRICVYYLGSFETPVLLEGASGFEDSYLHVS